VAAAISGKSSGATKSKIQFIAWPGPAMKPSSDIDLFTTTLPFAEFLSLNVFLRRTLGFRDPSAAYGATIVASLTNRSVRRRSWQLETSPTFVFLCTPKELYRRTEMVGALAVVDRQSLAVQDRLGCLQGTIRVPEPPRVELVKRVIRRRILKDRAPKPTHDEPHWVLQIWLVHEMSATAPSEESTPRSRNRSRNRCQAGRSLSRMRRVD
jgi:hypothetical protein